MRLDLLRVGACVFSVWAAFAPGHVARSAAAADSVTTATGRTRTVVAGERYRAGAFHRFLLGNDYRNLWAAPVEVPELDLHTVAGGLRPVKRVGGQETLGLAMKGADGRDYTFRGLDKDPSEILPPEYHGTFIDRILQDQIASSLPGGSVAVAPLLRAAGVLHVEPLMVVMPDDSLLGEFRPVFANLPGTFEEYPHAGDATSTFGATEIISGAEMWKRMDDDPSQRPDSRAFLTARLVDLLIGDWDRHRGQWRWAKLPDHERWQPIPEDRDQAFCRFEGLLLSTGRARLPQFVNFDEEYPGIEGLTWNGRDGDRRILTDLEKPVWDDVARDVKARITDQVIADAVGRLPEGYRKLEGAMLEQKLRHRRDELPVIAEQYYFFLAHKVDVHATDQADAASVSHRENGDVEVTVRSATAAALATDDPCFQRVFHPKETDEVRIYLGDGADSVVTSGEEGKITVRVIGGDGNDTADDRAGTRLRVSDSSGDNQVEKGDGTKIDTRPYTPPRRETAEWIPPRDWGRRTVFFPWIGGNSDIGVLFVAGMETRGFGFRKDPYADKQLLRVGYATLAGSFGGDYNGDFHRENTRTYLHVYAVGSGLDFLHFYGFGNETKATNDEDFYKVKHTEYKLEPALMRPMGKGWEAGVHLKTAYSTTDLGPDRNITGVQPYGTEDFFQAGAGASISLDTRDSDKTPTRGFHFIADGTVFPELGAVKSTFGEVHGDVAYYQPFPVRESAPPSLALRAGGKHVWGTVPYHEAAYIGGNGTLRGFPRQRFAGDAALFGNAELRLPLKRVYIFVPGSVGVYGLCDAGRVFLDGETSNKWHVAAGGGIWMSFLSQINTVAVSVASSDEGTRIYVHAGFAF